MTDLTFDILRAAVALAKNEQIKTAEELKSRLKDFYPNNDAEISQALSFWAKQTRY